MLNEKTIAEIAQQLGLSGNPGISSSELRRMEGKSDAELKREILRIRDQLSARGVPYQKQAEILRSMVSMMDQKQKARLQNIIELIEK